MSEDRTEIEELLVHYCYLTDYGMPERIPDEVFTDDGVLDNGLGEFRGRVSLRDWFVNGGKMLEARAHHLSNISIRVDGDGATARSYVTTFMWFSATEDRGPVRGVDCVLDGAYHDTLRRTVDGWRIAERRTWPHGPSSLAFGQPPDNLQPMLQHKAAERAAGRWPDR